MVIDPYSSSFVGIHADVGEAQILGVTHAASGEDDLLWPEHGATIRLNQQPIDIAGNGSYGSFGKQLHPRGLEALGHHGRTLGVEEGK